MRRSLDETEQEETWEQILDRLLKEGRFDCKRCHRVATRMCPSCTETLCEDCHKDGYCPDCATT